MIIILLFEGNMVLFLGNMMHFFISSLDLKYRESKSWGRGSYSALGFYQGSFWPMTGNKNPVRENYGDSKPSSGSPTSAPLVSRPHIEHLRFFSKKELNPTHSGPNLV